jgi:ribonuclease J
MNFNYKKYKDNILFLPLGGTDEIGVNVYLYHYKGKWVVIDLGIGFADSTYPGVDIIVPDIAFLNEIKKDIVGLVITHAHEDHLGAIQYLWQELNLPIYATKFTSAVLKAKLAEYGYVDNVVINEIKENSKFTIGVFNLEFVGLTHSVPEMQSVAIHTDKGTVFHTGDWKFDNNPLVGNTSNYDRLKSLGDDGVLAMVCDSTNIFNPGVSGSEGDLEKSLKDLVKTYNDKFVVITTFASNIARVHSVARAAKASGRKIAFAGRSLWRMYHAARDSGYLLDIEEPITTKEIMKYGRSNVLLMATGCQGEEFAAVTKMSMDTHPDISLAKEDVIIFASKIIPGNEDSIFKVFNKLCKLGVEVITEKDHFVHVSGHPNLDEMKQMYEFVRPKISIPVHGEPMHIHEHCHFAKRMGVEQALQVENGLVVKIDENSAEIVGKVSTGYLLIDGNFILPADSEILSTRRRMKDEGLVLVTIILNKKGVLLKAPIVLAPGVLDSKEDGEYFDKITEDIRDLINDIDTRIDSVLENKIRLLTKKFFKNQTAKNPRVIVQIQKIAV